MFINKVNFDLSNLFIKYRTIILSILALFTLIALSGLKDLIITLDNSSWFSSDEKIIQDEKFFQDTFPSSEKVMIFLECENVFESRVLQTIKEVSHKLLNLPYADSVTSILSISIPIGTDDEIKITNLFEDCDFNNINEINKNKEILLSKNSIRNHIISDDCKNTWIILNVNNFNNPEKDCYSLSEEVYKIITDINKQCDYLSLKGSGSLYSRYHEDTVMRKEVSNTLKLSFIIMIIALLFFLRSWKTSLLALSTSVLSILVVFGIEGYFHIRGNLSLILLPIILGCALSLGYSIHYINSFRMHLRICLSRKEAGIMCLKDTFWPLLFSCITTISSLISFIVTSITPIKWLGITCTYVVISVFIYSSLLIPLSLSYGNNLDNEKQIHKGATKTDLFFERQSLSILHKAKFIVLYTIIFSILCLPSFFKLKVNMDYIDCIGNKITYIQDLLSILNKKIGSQYNYNVLISLDENAFTRIENLEKLEKLQTYIGRMSLTSKSGNESRITSVINLIKELNKSFNQDEASYYSLPTSDSILREELFIYEISDSCLLYNIISEDYSTTYLNVEIKKFDNNQIKQNTREIVEYGQTLFPDGNISIVGEVIKTQAMNDKLVEGEIKSFLISFLVILILMTIVFRNFTIALISMIPNIAPVIVIALIMAFGRININTVTMTAMPILLGIAVDDTIHFVNKVRLKYINLQDYKTAIQTTFREIGKTLGTTTIILCTMFSVFIISNISSLNRIGILIITGLIVALCADYTVTPALIYITKPFKKEIK